MTEENVITFKPKKSVSQPDEIFDQEPDKDLKAHWYQISYMFSLHQGHLGIASYFNYRNTPMECVGKQEMLNRIEGAKHFIQGEPQSVTILGIMYLGYGTMEETIVQVS